MRPEDADWTALAELWREQEPPPDPGPALARRMRRHTWLMALITAIEVAVLATLGAFTVIVVRRGIDATTSGLLLLLWALALATEAFALLNRRGAWRADAADVASYVALAERRATAKIRAARAVVVLSVAQAAVVCALLVSLGTSPAWAAGASGLIAAVYVAWAAWYGRRARRELEGLGSLRRRWPQDDAVAHETTGAPEGPAVSM